MKKRGYCVALSLMMVLSLTACGKDTGNKAEQTTEPKATEAAAVSEEAVQKEVSNEKYESKLGYSMEYDTGMFERMGDEGSTDSFQLLDQQTEKDMNLYIAVQQSDEKTVKSAAKGLKLQSGVDNAVVETTNMGSEAYKTTSVSYEKKVDGTKVNYVFYVLENKKGNVLIVEVSGYTGMDEKIQDAYESMLGTFTLS